MRNYRRTGALILLALVSAGCSSPKKPPLRMGVNFWATTEFIFHAQSLGYFDREGIPVELVEYSSLNDLRRGFEQGQVDAMACSLVEVLMARENTSRRPQLVQVVDFSNGADFIVAKPGIANVTGLKGQRVGVETGSMGILVLGRALELAGLTLNDVFVISKDQSNMERTFSKGEVDAAVTYPPYSVGLDGKSGHVIFDSTRIPGEVVDIIAVDPAKISPGAADKLRRVWKRITTHVEEHAEESYTVMAKRERISLQEFQSTLRGIQVVSVEQQNELLDSGKLQNTLANMARFLHQVGVLRNESEYDDVLPPQRLISGGQ